MAVTEHDVRHVAALARLALPSDELSAFVAQLNGILSHMDVLAAIDTTLVAPVAGIGAGGMPLRADDGAPYAMHRDREAMAPAMREGFFLVPRLASHADAGAGGEGAGA